MFIDPRSSACVAIACLFQFHPTLASADETIMSRPPAETGLDSPVATTPERQYEAAGARFPRRSWRWDGKGYPSGLAGEDIPLGARVIAVADAFNAMTSGRPYSPARPYEDALRELEAGMGTQFEPRVCNSPSVSS